MMRNFGRDDKPGNQHVQNTNKENEEKEKAQLEMKYSILSQILDQSARARLYGNQQQWNMNNLINPVYRYFKFKTNHNNDIENLVNTLMVAKPEKAQKVEAMLIQMAQRGQLRTKIDESELINLLENVNQSEQKTATVKFDRRRSALDSDDDDDF